MHNLPISQSAARQVTTLSSPSDSLEVHYMQPIDPKGDQQHGGNNNHKSENNNKKGNLNNDKNDNNAGRDKKQRWKVKFHCKLSA